MAAALRRTDPRIRQVLTYDINCQYKVNFETRVLEGKLLDPEQLPEELEMKIPAWHIGGHVPQCQDDHHLRHTELAGRTCGEGPETLWTRTNGAKYATREMGHGHRQESLTDDMNDHNHGKAASQGESITSTWVLDRIVMADNAPHSIQPGALVSTSGS